VLILPPGHAREASAGRRLAPRERRLVAAMLALTAVLAAAVIVSLTGAGGDGARRGCLDVSFPSSLGVQQVVRCGAAAREACASVGTSAGFTGPVGRLVAADCRRLRIPLAAGSRSRAVPGP
jgi:hypothetical protein